MKPELFLNDNDELRAFIDYTKALVGTSLTGRDMLQLHGSDRRKSFPGESPGETATDGNLDNGAVCRNQLPD